MKIPKQIYQLLSKQIYQLLFPEFLQKLDRKFLLNNPQLWVLKLHYVGYYALLANLFIFFLVVLMPINYYQYKSVFIAGNAILVIIEIIGLRSWGNLQLIYDIERQYGYLQKRSFLIKILGYSLCILLITSGTIVFFNSLYIKGEFSNSKEKIAIDSLTLSAIQSYGFSRNIDKDHEYFKNFRNFLNSQKFLEQQQKPVSSDIIKLLGKNKIILLEKLINKENSTLLLISFYYDRSISTEDLKVEALKFLLDEQNSSAQKSIKSSLMVNLVDSIKNNKMESLASKVKEYTGKDILDLQQRKISSFEMNYVLNFALDEANSIWDVFFGNFTVPFLILYNTSFLALIITILYLFKDKDSYFVVFSMFPLFYTIVTINGINFIYVTLSLSYYPLFRNYDSLFPIIIFVGLLCIFVLYQALKPSKNRIYSRFKVLILGSAPFAVIILFVSLQSYYHYKGWIPKTKDETGFLDFIRYFRDKINSLDFIIYSCIGILLYLPFLSFIKSKLIQQLSLPKE